MGVAPRGAVNDPSSICYTADISGQRDDRMVMTSYDSPAAARRRLRLAVRKAREASGLTQGQVAEQLSWSISKVNRMENGEVTISPTDLSALLNLFGVNDRAVVNE